MQPTVVLVHGAFAESSSWDDVVEPLVVDGYRVVAAANPLRGLASDAAAVSPSASLPSRMATRSTVARSGAFAPSLHASWITD